MAELASKKIAVVGCNVSGLLSLHALKEKWPQFELKWFLASKDILSTHTPNWLCLPEQELKSLHIDIQKENTLDLEWQIHFVDYQHEALATFIDHPLRSSAQQIPLALRKKIESLALWNDLTPRPWEPNKGINNSWTQQAPASQKERVSSRFFLVARDSLLTQSTPVTLDTRIRVMGLDAGDTRHSTKLIYNAPFGSESFDAMLWTSHTSRPRLENSQDLSLSPLKKSPVGRWRTWVGRVPYKAVSFLKPATVWLDSGAAGHAFLDTGLFRTQTLRRLLCAHSHQCPESFAPKLSPNEALLQIEVLEFMSEPIGNDKDYRPDQFLWKHCPALKQLDASLWTESTPDENWIYADPFPVLHHYGRGLDFWSGGAFSNISGLLDHKALWPGHKLDSTTS
jgi:hypothetical protein